MPLSETQIQIQKQQIIEEIKKINLPRKPSKFKQICNELRDSHPHLVEEIVQLPDCAKSHV